MLLPLNFNHRPFRVLGISTFWYDPDEFPDDRGLLSFAEQKLVTNFINSLLEAYLFVLLLFRHALTSQGGVAHSRRFSYYDINL